MYFLLSGEGPTDMGSGSGGAAVCEGDDFLAGPMAVIVDQIVKERLHFSPLEVHACGFVSEGQIFARAGVLKAARKALGLPGNKRAKETRYFFNNARMLARIARERQADLDVPVVAVLFRDSDGSASAGRGLWKEKRDSIIHGFEEEGFQAGVPMIPKPKSEAWVLCALKKQYEGCEALEERSGNDNSSNSLKTELREILTGDSPREELCGMLRDGRIDYRRIEMPSFAAFRKRLEEVLR